jgi:hypothetical protein
MKTLKFNPQLVPLILFGEKTSTWRVFDDKKLSIGDTLSFIDKSNNEEFATAKILLISEKKFREISDADYDGHERFESKKKMLEAYKSYYGDKVTEDSVVKIINFKIL